MKRPLFGLGLDSHNYSRSRNLDIFEGANHRLRFSQNSEMRELLSFKEQQKQNADIVYEGTYLKDGERFQNLDNIIDPITGKPADLFVDTKGGHDCVCTGDGDDVVYLGDNKYYVSASTGGGDDYVVGSTGEDAALLGAGDDIYFGRGGGDVGAGQAGNDVMFGGNGFDALYGCIGEDFLDGQDGSDKLTGGIDADVFVVDLEDSGKDWIVDFRDIGDKILVKNGDGNALAGSDWFLQVDQVTDFQSSYQDIPPGMFDDINGLQCFNIVNAATGEIAASVTASSDPSSDWSNADQLIAVNNSVIQLVQGGDSAMTI
ncbi:Hemolysin-type calcium-binding region:RTX N-terminal domain [Synechococcus sp. RS9916]|nr:Hemolysin-type calcium-binding region:RTX N-terminal domain [Synechococcus sp. RS9916]